MPSDPYTCTYYCYWSQGLLVNETQVLRTANNPTSPCRPGKLYQHLIFITNNSQPWEWCICLFVQVSKYWCVLVEYSSRGISPGSFHWSCDQLLAYLASTPAVLGMRIQSSLPIFISSLNTTQRIISTFSSLTFLQIMFLRF